MSEEEIRRDGKHWVITPIVSETERGFHDYGQVKKDTYGHEFYVRESSSAEGPHVWLFTRPSPHMPKEQDGIGLHLNEEQARYIIACLQAWVDEIPSRWDRLGRQAIA